jgi:hypothetical protein
MTRNHITRRSGLALLALMMLLALGSTAGRAAGYSPGCGQVPIVYGIPPWSFHTGPPIGETGSFARGHGQINLEANTVSGILCQERRPLQRTHDRVLAPNTAFIRAAARVTAILVSVAPSQLEE